MLFCPSRVSRPIFFTSTNFSDTDVDAEQQKSILAIALYVAFADGAKHEREEIRCIAESFGGEVGTPDVGGG